jgi:acetyltransferase-like isoleucine patch superfamily enzyme
MSFLSHVKTHAYFGRIFLINIGLSLPSHRLRRTLLRTIGRWHLPASSTVMRGCRVLALGGVTVGERTVIGDGCLVDGRGGLSIGSDTNISGGTSIYSAGHDFRSTTFAGVTAAVHIGDRCWVASRALVLPGTTMGDGVVLAGGTVARGNLSEWTVYAGNPAERIATRPTDAQIALKEYRAPFM